jgi:hypothetical protein
VKSELVASKDVANKIIKKNRSTHYQELKRVETSKKSGTSTDQEYKQEAAWFAFLHSFLIQPDSTTLGFKQASPENVIDGRIRTITRM